VDLAERAAAEFSFLGKNVNIFAVEFPFSDDRPSSKATGASNRPR
jgi:hypothetical protein